MNSINTAYRIAYFVKLMINTHVSATDLFGGDEEDDDLFSSKPKPAAEKEEAAEVKSRILLL